VALDGCLAALHASHNLGLDFNCLRANVTGVLTSADMSGCKVAAGDKAQSLNKTIHELKPDANAKQAAKDAEQQAKDDLRGIGSSR
jgi:acid phosphatase family membrane protein YuiD